MLLPSRLLRRSPATLFSVLLLALSCVFLFSTVTSAWPVSPNPLLKPQARASLLENDNGTPTDPSTTPVTGYAYCVSPRGSGNACRYVASSVSGYDACNVLEKEGGSLSVYKGTTCVLFADEVCGGDEKSVVEGDASKVIEGQAKIDDLAAFKMEKKSVRSFRCGFSEES